MKKLIVMLALLFAGCGGSSHYISANVIPAGMPLEKQAVMCIKHTCDGIQYFFTARPADTDQVPVEDAASGWCFCIAPEIKPKESFNRYRF